MNGWTRTPISRYGTPSRSSTNVRQVTAAATQSETTEMAQDGFTAGRSGRSRSARSRSNAAPAIPPGLGTTCPTTRSQLELAAKHRLFQTVFPAGQGRLTTGVATGDTEMADATPTVSNTETPNAETAPEPMVPAGHVEQSDQGLSEQAGRASVPSMPGEEPHPGGYELDVSTMGCRPEEVAGGQEKGCLDGQDASAHAGAHRGLQRPTLVVKFQGLATSTQQPTIPWKLQLNMRMDRPYDLLHTLTHNAVWLLAGTSLKVHSTQPSQLTRQVQNMLPQTKGRGKGKSKHKGKAQAAPSP